MRKIIYSILVLSFLFLTHHLHAQSNLYSRVKIYVGVNGLRELAAKGVAIDHGTSKQNTYFISDFSSAEVDIIKASRYPYEILIKDVSKYYRDRNTVISNSKTEDEEQSLECKYCSDYKTPSNFKLGSMGGFYTYNEMLVILDSMAAKYPSLITVKSPVSDSTTQEGRSILYVKISDQPTVKENEPEILFTSLHHAREPESMSQLLFFMWYLLENYGANPEVTYIVNNLELYFIPCVNPDGYIYNQSTDPAGGGMWRKNRKNNGDGTFGVDLNRNYGFNFGLDNTGSSPFTNSDSYRGPTGFSEPETQVIREFCKQHQFKIAINNHTFGEHLVIPWDYGFNLVTPDTNAYDKMGKLLTYCSYFDFGTPSQTFGYLANGGSNDWMYGEQSEKNKIFTFSPEAGIQDDGFWPLSSRIVDIAKVTMHQNLKACKLAGIYGEVEDRNDVFILEQEGYIKYRLTRLGGEHGELQISITALDNSVFNSIGISKSYTTLKIGENIDDSISFTLNSTIVSGANIDYVIHVSNGLMEETDTVKRVFGEPQIRFYDSFNSADSWNIGSWGLTASTYSSSPSCITDSPNDFYQANQDNAITTLSYIDLTDAHKAWLHFDGLWDIEAKFDFAEVLVSTDGNIFTPLCGKQTKKGNANQDLNKPIFDAQTRGWIRETINLSDYLGQKIKLRFRLKTDFGENRDGIYIDEVKVYVVSDIHSGVEEKHGNTFYIGQNIPNPCKDKAIVSYNLPEGLANTSLELFNQVGERIESYSINNVEGFLELDLSSFSQGIYYYSIASGNNRSAVRKLVLIK